MAEYTETPWSVGGEMLTPAGTLQLLHVNTVVGYLKKPHADAIVKRLNSHATLLEALKRLAVEAKDIVQPSALAQADAALALARGEPARA